MASVAWETKRAIQAGLETVFTGDDALVSYGYPNRTPPAKFVMVGRITWDETSWQTFPVNQGATSRREEFSIAVIANAMVKGGLETDIDPLLEEMSNQIEDWLRANRTLGVPGIWSVEYKPGKSQAYPVADGYEGQIQADVTVKART